jgi:AAA+ ATPase superfamily predicted ATPase
LFYGRRPELDKLSSLYGSGQLELVVIYGRRRVGKTTLIREFIRDKEALFFAASESTASENLASLSRCIGGKSASPIFSSFDDALEAVFDAAEARRLVFVIDEYPYLAASYPAISSLLQILIDHRKDSSKLMLILCGSSMSFMENQVLGHKSPLYGRRSAQLKLLPFTFFEALPFFANYKATDKALLFGMTGGIPEYLCGINTDEDVRQNIIDLFLSPQGRLFEEPSNLIKQELREPAVYNVIIEAIAAGASKLNEIASKSGMESNKCAKYLTSLIALGLVRKEYPFGDTSRKRSIYRLEDMMFRFWYRFVFPNMSAIVMGLGTQVYDNEIEPQLDAYMGLVFEDICKQWLFLQAKRNELPFFIGNLGRWWGTNNATKGQEEIDIVARQGREMLFAECKWAKSRLGLSILDDLRRKSQLLWHEAAHLYLFAKEGFADELFAAERASDAIRLFDLSMMIESAG